MNPKATALLLAVGLVALVALAVKSSDAEKAPTLLCDFETEDELRRWQEISSELSRENKTGITSGSYSGWVRFQPSQQASGILFKRSLQENSKLRDWREFSGLAVDIFNPGDAGRIIFKIKDAEGASFTTKVDMKSRSADQLVIYLEEMMVDINVREISQIQIYFWNLEEAYDLYFDNLRLLTPSTTSVQPSILQERYLAEASIHSAVHRSSRDFERSKADWIHLPTGAVRVPLYLNNVSGAGLETLPVSGGIPFPGGQLRRDDGIRLVSESGEPMAAQTRPLGFWTDGSVKWLEVTTRMSISGRERETLFLEYGGRDQTILRAETPLVIQESDSGFVVETGPIRFQVSRGGFRLFDRVWLDQDRDGQFAAAELISNGSDLIVVFGGEEYRSSLDTGYALTLEQRGPLRAVIKAEGWFVSSTGEKFCRFSVRIHAHAGEDALRVVHTFVYTGYPENTDFYLYRGKKLPRNEAPEAIRIDTALALSDTASWSFGADGANIQAQPGTFGVFQDTSDSYRLLSAGKQVASGKRLEGWADAGSIHRGVTVTIKKLWQQFPKGWSVEGTGKVLSTHLWPAASGPLDLRTTEAAGGEDAAGRGSAFGLAKTHQLTYRFHRGEDDEKTDEAAISLRASPPLLSADPSWVAATLAIGRVRAYDPDSAKSLEQGAERIFDWANRQVQDFSWYGMIDYGDTLSWYREKGGQRGWFPDGRWGWLNNEAMGLHSGALVQYLRTGRDKYFDFAESVAMHSMDVDTVHFNTVANDSRLQGVIPDDFSRVGSQHRHNADHWGGRNEETSHTNLHGILLYYYITGYDRALEVAKEMGEFLLEGRVTYFGHPDNCPQRNIANVLWGMSELYEVTGDARYKTAADEWADVLFRGQTEDGTWLEKYNPLSKRWRGKPKTIFTLQYTLPALIAYHRITGNGAIATTIVKATDHYIRERPYNPYFEALSYSYDLTGDRRYLKSARTGVKYLLSKQRRGGGPIEDGMIFSKLTYLRPVEFLYQIPFAFDALDGSPSGKPN